MRNLILTLLCFAASFSVSAQTQTGIVKTKGRLGSNGQVIAGQRLSGATVQVKGRNAVVSKADGTFSFPVPANKFSIESVSKKGYELVDADAITIQYTYSPNPLILVMETPKKLKEDKLAVEQNLHKNLFEEKSSKYEELKSLLDQNIITKEEYQTAWWKLQDEFTSKELAIDYMANYYSRIDYDQLDEYDLNLSDCILNGRLNEAYDLWCSRDGIDESFYYYETAPNKEIELYKLKQDIAQDYYNKYTISLFKNQVDSAAHYIELRAALDTTNNNWQNDAGMFFQNEVANYDLALKYYMQALEWARDQYGEQSEDTGTTYRNIGSVYNDLGDFVKALDYYQKALYIFEQVLGKDNPLTQETRERIESIKQQIQ